MSDPFLGEIRCFGFNYAPNGWAMCNGQVMSIIQNTALFTLLGTTYGGDGITTYALPNLQGRVGMHLDSTHIQGDSGGEESHTLTKTELPAHNHGIGAATAKTATDPSGAWSAKGGAYAKVKSAQMAPTGMSGGTQPHNNLQPFLVLNYCICLEGLFPSRP